MSLKKCVQGVPDKLNAIKQKFQDYDRELLLEELACVTYRLTLIEERFLILKDTNLYLKESLGKKAEFLSRNKKPCIVVQFKK